MLSPKSVRTNICKLMNKLSASGSKSSYRSLENDGETNNCGKVRVARGCVAIYVGEDRKRYQVRISYLSLPMFQELIKCSFEDALDVKIDGPITVACTTKTFDQLLKIAKNTALD